MCAAGSGVGDTMSEEGFYNQETPRRPEHTQLPEHTSLPEYNPVYPDVTFFKESSVTTKEENIFQGEPPAGEARRISREEKRKKRERYSLLQKLLGLASRGGAAALAAVVVVSAVSFAQDGSIAQSIKKAIQSAQRPAFTQQTGYDPADLVRLWEMDPNAPHKYDTEHPLAYRAATCTEDGEEEYVCLECGVHSRSVLAAAGHTEGDPVTEDEVPATCIAEGSYVRIIRCSVCGEELSRQFITIAKADHTPGEPKRADEVEPTCTEEGSYSEIIVCSVCGEELSRTVVTIAAKGHTPDEAVRQHEIEATCTEGGSYEEVVLCADCGEEISRRTVTVAALGHSAAAAVRENQHLDNCQQGGTYESVVYCSRCGQEMSRTMTDIAPKEHTAGTPVQEWLFGLEDGNGNYTGPDCLDGGVYQNVTYCSVCGTAMTYSDEIRVDPPGHSFSTSFSNGSNPKCSRCGMAAIEAYYGSSAPYVYYYFDETWFNDLQGAGIYVSNVRLWCLDSNSEINSGGYEGMDPYGDIDVPDEYREPGTRLRVDIFFSNGKYASSNTVTVE